MTENKFSTILDINKLMTDYFPFDSFRQYQKETIEDIEKSLQNGIKDVNIEMPTGSGKSAIAVSAGLWSENAYCLTSQKILQDQYVRDFTENYDVAVLKGRGNYECTFLGDPAKCDECYEPAKKSCIAQGSCLYRNAKLRASMSKVALMNYSYFLNVTDCDPQKLFKPRKLIIFDEAHSLENELMGQIEFLLSEFNFKRLGYIVNVPTLSSLSEYHAWMHEHMDKLNELLKQKNKEIDEINRYRVNLDKTSKQFKKVSKEATELIEKSQELDRLYRRMNVFISTLDTVEWVFTIEKTDKKQYKRVVFKPLTVDKFAEQSLLRFGSSRIYLSATILDKGSFCKSLGIQEDTAKFIRTPSTFPAKNRPIIFTNTGYMNLKEIDNTLPKIVNDVKKALDYHRTEKGLIHCNSYKIAKYIEENCWNDRLIFHDSGSRESALQRFIESDEPKVLISPSMTEGLDLKGDLARWEIIVKIPYPYLGDKQISRRMKIDPDWYVWQTCLKLVQSYGRIFRSENDWGSAYIFDSGAQSFIGRNRDILPKWFLDAMQKQRHILIKIVLNHLKGVNYARYSLGLL